MKAISIIILFTFLIEYSKCELKLSAVDIGSLAVGTAPYDDCGMRFTGTISIKVKTTIFHWKTNNYTKSTIHEYRSVEIWIAV